MLRTVFALGCIAIMQSTTLFACTRCLHTGEKNTVVVGRSMDWMEDPGTEIYAFPKGMKRDGACGPGSIEWTSKFGSVICSFYGVSTVDGINEKGLVANVLYLVESNYGKSAEGRPNLSISTWAQYTLDNFATVADAVKALSQEPFTVVAPILPNGSPAHGHLSISDPSGDSAIVEYVDGKLVIHHDRKYQVMTNSPTFDQQLALNEYWKTIGGDAMLPGTNRAADRFVRASFYNQSVPKSSNDERTVATVTSIIRSVSVPLGLKTPSQPNIANTVWRTVYDQKNKRMYFDSATSPNVFWVDISDLNFNEGASTLKLALKGGKIYHGNAASEFKPAQPFEFLPGKP